MHILLDGTIEFIHIEQVSALFTFRLGQVLLYFCSFINIIYYKPENTAVRIRCADHVTPSTRKSWH
jgi:hypothetical protein